VKRLTIVLNLITIAVLVMACGSTGVPTTSKAIKSAPAANNLTVSLATSDGVLKHGNTEFTLSFTDAAGKPVDVGAVSLTFQMPQMGTMQAMNNPATFTTTETPGVYRGKAKVEMSGEWQAKITYEGPAGSGQVSFPVTVQ
jgi:nitrogen fixation protein FixH